MSSDGNKRSQVSAAVPPRKINVLKFAESRASELESLHSIVSNRLNGDFRSRRDKRRRTTSYDNQAAKRRYRKRRKLDSKANKSNGDNVSEQGRLPRHVRRRIELRKNPVNGFSTSGDGTKRLRTHVWHAKRFAMTKLWGFHLPLGLQGRGRGSRALLKLYKKGAVVHDSTYYSAVQVDGPEVSLVSILGMVLETPSSSESEEISSAILSGARYGSAILHHVGGPFSQPIAPVIYMWRPCHPLNGRNGRNNHGTDELQNSESCSSHRQVWVWIHASAFSEGHDALQFACQKLMDESGILINCFSLEGQLAKLEVMGSKAFQLLQKILRSDACNSKNSWELKKCAVEGAKHDCAVEVADHNTESSILENEDSVSSCAVLSFTVGDPRVTAEKGIPDVPMAACAVENNEYEYGPGKGGPVSEGSENLELFPLSSSKPQQDTSVTGKKTLWDANSRITSPVEENALCLEKKRQRMDFLSLGNPKSGILDSSSEAQGSRSCPIMLLKNNYQIGSFMGWSIIIPLSWVRVFWISLISKGAHAIGQREKQWIACDVGLPVFPSDFPDSNAYSSCKEIERTAVDQKATGQPLAVRPLKVPIPPPWNCIRATVESRFSASHDAPICCSEDIINCNLLPNSKRRNGDIASTLRVDSISFNGIVARTSHVLADFLKEICGDQLLLFPQGSNGQVRIIETMKEENVSGSLQNGITRLTHDRKLCFVRVCVHAYKEGVFEEGAVICAPCLGDLQLWTSRSEENDVGFQIPQACVSSFFKEQSSGKWELQLPEEPATRESYRWPVGFITTGFVRGSKKPVAVGLCEAVLLARLREEQWNGIPVEQRKKEIYVLIRNLRSSAYRLAVASIILEEQEDLEFL